MNRFSYRAYDRDGALVAGELSAADRPEALAWLRGRGLLPIEIASGVDRMGAVSWWDVELTGGPRASQVGLAQLCRELALLLRADLPVDQALEAVQLQPTTDRRMRQAVGQLHSDVVEGMALSAALERQGSYFPDNLSRLVRAGEQSGALAEALHDLGRFLAATNATRARMIGALIYPAILVLASFAAIAVILVVLLPTIVPLLKDAGAPLPPVIAFLDGASRLASSHLALIAGGVAAAMLSGVAAYASSLAVQLKVSGSLLLVPVFGKILQQSAVMRFCRTLAMLLRNGVPMLDALGNAAQAVGNRTFKARLAEIERRVGEGAPLSTALQKVEGLPELVVRLTAVGEQTGDVPSMLDHCADIFQQAVEQRLDRIAVLITPVLTILIGLVVGGLILTVLDALSSINDLAIR